MVGVLGLSQHQAHGTSLAIIVPTAIVAVTQYFVAPHAGKPPPLELAVAYAATAIVGAPIGARLIVLVNPDRLRRLFGLLLLSLAAGSLTRRTALEPWGNLFLAAGLVALLAGALAIAIRQHRAGGSSHAPTAPAETRAGIAP
jgi:hypothetical protein